MISSLLRSLSLKHNISLLDLEILLCHVLQIERSFLKSHSEIIIDPIQLAEFYTLVSRRTHNEPIAYIIGNKNFWDLNLIVTKDVLIPRPETEMLVEKALEILPNNSYANVLELGTGSGAISLSLAKHRHNIIITATDVSTAALNIAKINAKKLNINNINFLYSNWFDEIYKLDAKFDVIISNPPYIAFNEINLCNQEIFYEPKLALFSDNNGLKYLEHIVFSSKKYLKNNAYLLLEHGFNQAKQLAKFLQIAGFSEITSFKDLSYLDRITVAKNIKNF